MTSEPTRFFVYGEIPVKMERSASGGLRVLAFNPRTRSFQLDASYRNAIFHDRDGLARTVTETDFDVLVQRLQAGSPIHSPVSHAGVKDSGARGVEDQGVPHTLPLRQL